MWLLILLTQSIAQHHAAQHSTGNVPLCRYLVARKVKGVGCDYISIEGERDQSGSESGGDSESESEGESKMKSEGTYKTLLGGGVAIIEGLRLADAQSARTGEEGGSEGHYMLACLFLRLNGVEAAPARAVLLPLGR
jgi:kynurenine formamidase